MSTKKTFKITYGGSSLIESMAPKDEKKLIAPDLKDFVRKIAYRFASSLWSRLGYTTGIRWDTRVITETISINGLDYKFNGSSEIKEGEYMEATITSRLNLYLIHGSVSIKKDDTIYIYNIKDLPPKNGILKALVQSCIEGERKSDVPFNYVEDKDGKVYGPYKGFFDRDSVQEHFKREHYKLLYNIIKEAIESINRAIKGNNDDSVKVYIH